MDYQERSRLVRRISIGNVKTNINFASKDHLVLIRDPDQHLMYDADYKYDQYYDKALDQGLMTREDSIKKLYEEGLWTNQNDIDLKFIDQEISRLKKSMPSLRYKKINYQQVQNAIKQLDSKKEDMLKIKNQYDCITAEYVAESMKRKYIISHSCELDDEFLIRNPSFINLLMVKYYTKLCPKSTNIREVARSDPWRLYWLSSKETGMSLFHNESTNMTELQHCLILWSRIYDFAYNSQNAPDDETMQDDDRFDQWYEYEIENIKKENKNSNSDKPGFSGSSEIYIPADKIGAKDVYNLNDDNTRNKIKNRSKVINEKGSVAEFDLPDVKNRVIMEKNRQSAEAVRQRT